MALGSPCKLGSTQIIAAGTSMFTAAIGWGGAAIPPGAAKAAERPQSDPSQRQWAAAFEFRQGAAQSCRDAPRPLSKGDEACSSASFTKTLPHNDAGEVDAELLRRS
jgi:hypothetical protein